MTEETYPDTAKMTSSENNKQSEVFSADNSGDSSVANDPKTKSKLKQYAVWGIWLVVLVGAGWFISAALEEFNAEGGEEGIFICNDQECFKTTHIHSDVTFDLCGESPVLPRETGPLSGLHTHKEKNYLHFHDKLQLHPDDHAQYYDERLSIFDIIEVFELDPIKYCGTDDVIIEVYENEQLLPDRSAYNREDGDDIHLVYKRK